MDLNWKAHSMSDSLKPSAHNRDGGEKPHASENDMERTFVPEMDAADSPMSNAEHLVVDSDGGVDYGATVTGRPMPDDDENFEDESHSFDAGLAGGITIVPGGNANDSGDAHGDSFDQTLLPRDQSASIGSSHSSETSHSPILNSGMSDSSAHDSATSSGTASKPESTSDLSSPVDVDRTFVGMSMDEEKSAAGADDADDSTPTLIPSMGGQPSPQGSFESTIVHDSPPAFDPEGGTIVNQSGVELAADRPRDLNQTNPQQAKSDSTDGSHSMSSGSSGSRAGSGASGKISSQIWVSPSHASVEELISIRTRTVSGSGQFKDFDDADFEIVEKLAEGGMGVVYVARQKSLNRELAIKTLKSGAASFGGTVGRSNSAKAMSRADRQKREMFLSEALVTANLVHPNIIPIHELAQTGEGLPYYVMKRVHGIPWNKRVREMSMQENLDVLHKVCDAIAYAHHHGVINRDLKPENIMLGEFGEVLVLDWGLAVPAPHAAELNFRSPVASFGAGTPAYMSPELWAGPPDAIGECSDIYLLGAILYEVVTGHPPHEFPKAEKSGAKSDVWKIIDNVLRENVIRKTDESGELLDIALKAMRTNPDERFGSVLELQFAVRNFQRHEESRRLSVRASELIDSQASPDRDYHTCQTAAALYEEALRTWTQNGLARNGLRSTRLIYAKLASRKGDYDLGLQIATLEKDPEFETLTRQLKSARRIRSSVKWTALAAMLCVVALGAKSIYDNGIITNLNAEVTFRKQEADTAVAQADEAKASAGIALKQAETARTDAAKSQQEAIVAQSVAESAKQAALKASREAIMAQTEAVTALASAEASKKEAEEAIAQVDVATKQVLKATAQLAVAERDAAAALDRQAKAEEAAIVAQVEIQSQSIRGLALNENYADALREIDRLLASDLLKKLPETLRNRRTTELTAQQQQLLKRALPSEDPVQTQALSADGTLLAMGDAAGRITVLNNPADAMAWPRGPIQELRLEKPVSHLRFVDAQTLLISSGSDLLLWTFGQKVAEKLHGHEAPLRSIDVQEGVAISGDESGQLFVWDLTKKTVLAELRANTSIRAVCLIPGTRDFIYAGARGGQSADILAYRLPASPTNLSPERLGQLRMSRQHTYPPSQLSIAPNGSLLVISNSTNGDLMALKRDTKSSDANPSGFPFEQPADLEGEGDMSWLLSHHSRPVNDLQWSADGLWFLTASDDRRIGLWSRPSQSSSARTMNFERFLRGHGARVFQARFLDRTGSRLSSSSADGFCRLWNLKTIDDDSREVRGAFQLSALNQSPKHRLRDAVRRTQYTLTIAPASGLQAKELTESITPVRPKSDATAVVLNRENRLHRGSIRAVQFDRDGRQLVSGAADGSVVVWDVASQAPVTGPAPMIGAEHFHEGHESNISRMSLIGESRRILATAGFDGSLRLWTMDASSGRTGTQQQVVTGLGLVNTFASSPDGRLLITSAVHQGVLTPQSAQHTGECRIWRLDDLLNAPLPAPIAGLIGVHRAEVTSISVSSDSQRIATGGRDGIIAVWDASSAQCLGSVRAHGKDTIVTALKWLSDGTLLSAGLDGKLARWSLQHVSAADSEVATETTVRPFRLVTHQKLDRDRTPIEQISLASDENRLLVTSVRTDRRLKTTTYHLEEWKLNTPDSPCAIIPAMVSGKVAKVISSAQWSPDGKRALVCVDDAVQVFETDTWRVERVVAAGTGGVTDAQFVDSNTAEQQIVTFDGSSAALWNLSSGEQLAAFRGPYPVTSVGFLELDRQKLVLSAGETLRLFNGDADSDSFGRPLFHLQKSEQGRIAGVSICPNDASQMLTADVRGELATWRWNPNERRLQKSATLASLKTSVTAMQYSPDGERIAGVTHGGELIVLDREGTELIKVQPGGDLPVELTTVDFTAQGQHVAVGGRIARTAESIGWVVNVQRAAPGNEEEPPQSRVVCRLSGHEAGGISSLRFISETPYVVSGGHDGAMILWNWQDALPSVVPAAYEAYRFLEDGQMTAHQGAVTTLSVAPSGNICSGSEDGRVVLWNLPLLTDRD